MVTDEECRSLLHAGSIIKPNPDISGIGVMLAFLISAYVSFTAILGAYISGMVEPELLASVDSRIMRIRSRVEKHPRIHRVLRQTVLAFSDQQIVTGIAIMIAGFVGLHKGDISVYHYQIVLYLAWLSSSVHLSALTLLRPYLNAHPGVKAWRLTGMLVLFLMLVIGLVPTVSYDWGIVSYSGTGSISVGKDQPTGWGMPAVCFWGKAYGDGVNNDAPIGYILLVVSYLWKVGDLFASTRSLYGSRVRRPLERMIASALSKPARRYVETRRRRWLWQFRMLLVPTVPLIAFLELLASFSASLWISVLGLVFGTVQVVVPRNQNYEQIASQEDEWGFGQLVPLVLLIQPLGAISEHLYTGRRMNANAQANGDALGENRTDARDEPRVRSQPGESKGPTTEARTAASERPKVLIEILGRTERRQTLQGIGADVRRSLSDVLLSSRLLTVLVILLHLTLLFGTVLILFLDVISIGILRGQNWQFALLAIAFYVAASWGTMLLFAPFSRLGRGIAEHREVFHEEGRERS